MKQKSKGNAKTSPGKSGKKANKSVLLNRLIVIGTAILILGGLVAGFFIWQNSIYYTVTFEDVTGVTYTYDALTVKKGGDFTFEISLQQRFAIYDDLFAVTVNGEKIEKTDDHYEIKNVDKNLSIFVSGVGTMNLTITGTSLLGGTTTEEDLYIPYGVEEIAASSFISRAAFKKVVIPDSVKLIGPEAFLNCINLATIEIGDNVERIGQGAFHQTAWFTVHTDGTIYLGNWLYAFKGYSTSKNFLIKEGTVGIAEYAFAGHPSMEGVELPGTLKYICAYAFCDIRLKQINLPDGLEYIGAFAFVHTDITELTVPQSVQEIAGSAFLMCGYLQNVRIESVATFGENVFTACNALETVCFANGAKNISVFMFGYCDILEEVIINSTEVPDMDNTNAFAAVPNLKIYVPQNSVNSYKTADGWSAYSDKIYAITE